MYVSVVSLWEIAVKARIGKLEADTKELIGLTVPSGFRQLDLRASHLIQLVELPVFPDHRDPFDQLLIAQAKAEALVFLSADPRLRRYPVAFQPA